MKIKLYRSATVGIISDNYKLLTDPWLTDGEYYGSWSHYPYFDLDKTNVKLSNYLKESNKKLRDNLYISYDFMLNEKYKININKKSLDRIKNYFR